VLDLIVKGAAEVFGAKGSCLMLLNPRTRKLNVMASCGLSRAYLDKGAVDADRSVAETMKGKVVAIADAATDSRVQYPHAAKKEGVSSILVVPLKLKNQVMGALRLYMAERRDFTPDETGLACALAVQGALALENARLLETISEHYKIFREVGKSINSTLKIEDVMQIIVKDITDVLNVKGACLRLLDKDRKRLELVAAYGLSEKYLSKGPVVASSRIPDILLGETVFIDTSSDMRLQYAAEAMEEGIRSILSVPIKMKDEVRGVLRLYSDYVREFTPEEISLAEALAEQSGIAIENATMYSQMKENYEDLKDDLWSHRSWF